MVLLQKMMLKDEDLVKLITSIGARRKLIEKRKSIITGSCSIVCIALTIPLLVLAVHKIIHTHTRAG